LREEFIDTGLHVKEVLATNCDPIGPCERPGDADGALPSPESTPVAATDLSLLANLSRLATRRSGVASSHHL
jgi:hypothetical protein